MARSGRPVLLAPAGTPAKIGDVVALAWNGSSEVGTALAASLPLLVAAERVVVITVGDGNIGDIPAVLEYLAWHGIGAEHRHTPLRRARAPASCCSTPHTKPAQTSWSWAAMDISRGERRFSAA